MKIEKGFTVIETILVLVIIAILGGTGWFVYNAHKNANKTLDQASQVANSSVSASKKATKPVNNTANWLQWTAPDKSFQMKIPDGWNLNQNSETTGDLQTFDDKLAI